MYNKDTGSATNSIKPRIVSNFDTKNQPIPPKVIPIIANNDPLLIIANGVAGSPIPL